MHVEMVMGMRVGNSTNGIHCSCVELIIVRKFLSRAKSDAIKRNILAEASKDY